MKNNDYTRPLQALGFTEIEALVYGYLVENSPATGYRISHAIGKQPPNTYKAIATLEEKGAIIVEVGDKKLCRAIPPLELLNNLEQRFRQHRQEASSALEALSRQSPDSGIYHLKTVDQVIQRSKAMLKRAQGIVLCELFPGPFALLRDSLRESAARGVRVACKVYNDEQLPGVNTYQLAEREQALDIWPGQQISVIVDSEEYLIGLISRDMTSVHEAVWSNSTFLSCIHHNNVSAEILFTAIKSEYPDLHASFEKKLNHISLLTFKPTGLDTLCQQCHTAPPSSSRDGTS